MNCRGRICKNCSILARLAGLTFHGPLPLEPKLQAESVVFPTAARCDCDAAFSAANTVLGFLERTPDRVSAVGGCILVSLVMDEVTAIGGVACRIDCPERVEDLVVRRMSSSYKGLSIWAETHVGEETSIALGMGRFLGLKTRGYRVRFCMRFRLVW